MSTAGPLERFSDLTIAAKLTAKNLQFSRGYQHEAQDHLGIVSHYSVPYWPPLYIDAAYDFSSLPCDIDDGSHPRM